MNQQLLIIAIHYTADLAAMYKISEVDFFFKLCAHVDERSQAQNLLKMVSSNRRRGIIHRNLLFYYTINSCILRDNGMDPVLSYISLKR